MILPRDGRIVVIDDKPEEAVPLLRSLAKNGLAALYFTGAAGELPPVPLPSVRVVFLDMELETGGYTGTDNKSKAAAAARVFTRVIDASKPATYLVIMWARHEELAAYFWEYVTPGSHAHFIQARLDKAKCHASGYDLAVIATEIEAAVRDKHAFNFFVQWQNNVQRACDGVVTDIQTLFGETDAWDTKTLLLLKKLAEAQLGKYLDATDREQIAKNAMLAFNGAFIDSLEDAILTNTGSGIEFGEGTATINPEVTAKVNSKLLLSHDNTLPRPGSVYKEDDPAALEQLATDCFENAPGNLARLEAISCEVSPICDFAQKKWKVHRVVHGLRCPVDSTLHVRKKADYIYTTPTLFIDGQACFLVFDMRQLKAKSLEELAQLRPWVTLRYTLVAHIQHRIAHHFSRLGLICLW